MLTVFTSYTNETNTGSYGAILHVSYLFFHISHTVVLRSEIVPQLNLPALQLLFIWPFSSSISIFISKIKILMSIIFNYVVDAISATVSETINSTYPIVLF